VKAVVLIGGQGTRLRPLTETIPKQMLAVATVPMVERVLGALSAFGVDRAVLSLGWRPERFLSALSADSIPGMSLRFVVEEQPLDTAGAARFAMAEAGLEGTVLVLNGDVLADLDLRRLVELHRERAALASVALTEVEDPSAFGVVVRDSDGRVRAFVEKPPREAAPSRLINAGAYVLEAEALSSVRPGQAASFERGIFPALVEAGKLWAFELSGYWRDTGTPAQLLGAMVDLVAGRRGRPAPDARELAPGIWVRDEAQVGEQVGGPCLVARGAFVEDEARLEASAVGEGARVARGARVVRSELMAGAVVSEGAVVVDSIVGPGASVGAGAIIDAETVVGERAVVAAGASLHGARVSPDPDDLVVS
jgi:mannose-1-phosphate guanylyltransferase